ncbi:hypothetical protein cypCar_00050226, partial [Cyprinus carpio]
MSRAEGNSVGDTESNGERASDGEAADGWPGGVDGEGGGPALVEDTGEVGTPDGEEEGIGLENCLDERPADLTQNCEDLSPPGQEEALEGNGGDTPGTIVMIPLEGSNAELRTRVTKEVRKPGRNYEAIFRLLEEVKGPASVQRYFIHHAIKEAAR